MAMIEPLLAGATLALCVALLVRLMLGARRRQRFDAALVRFWRTSRRHALHLWHWRARRQAARQAAAEAIRRASSGSWDGTRDGNVYKPRSFRKPPRDKMH